MNHARRLLGGLLGAAVWAGCGEAATYTVNRTDDIAPRGTGVTCITAASSDCTLREAIIKANANAGADTIVFAASTNGTPITLSIANAGGTNEDNSATGDLDVNDSLTITGNGSANTIIQAGTTASNGIDKVLAVNPFCTSPIAFAMSGVTIRFGRNTQPWGAADFSYTGGGIDLCGTGASSFTLTNVVVANNTNVNGYGGGINIDEAAPANGVVTFNNVTIQSNTSGAWGGGLNVFGDDVQVTITGSTIQGNTAQGAGGNGGAGGGINLRITHQTASPVPFLILDSTTVSGNSSQGWGGGISVSGSGNQDFTLRNSSVVSGNTVHAQGGVSSEGGGIYITAPTARTNSISSTTISGNHSDELASSGTPENPEGGGILVDGGTVTLGAGTVVSTNTSKDGAGIFVRAAGTTTVTATGITVSGNTATGSGGALRMGVGAAGGNVTLTNSQITGNSAGVSGGAFLVAIGTLNASKNRVAGNTAPAAAGLVRSSGTATIANDWWACSSDPTAGGTPCNAVSGASATPWLRVLSTPGSATIATNQTTGLTASVNTNSAGTDVTGTVGVLIGLPVTWSAVGGSISGAQTTIQPAGTATATFTATAAGADSAAAVVDSDGTSPVRFNVAQITVNKASTTIAAPGQGAATTVTGESFSVTWGTPTGAFGNSPTAPTGSVTVSDGVNSCTGTIASGGCTLTLFTAGTRTLTATYLGDANFAASPASASISHLVNKADTTSAITSDAPDPSVVGQAVPVSYAVSVTSPGSGTPTGNVVVTDGTISCTGTVAAGTCSLTFTSPGARSLTATYQGDSNYNGSPASPVEAHGVNKAGTTAAITSDAPDPSVAGAAVPVNYSVSVTSPGAGTPTGNVQVSDGTVSCTATVAAGTCNLTMTVSGAHTITATYQGDSDFNASPASPGAAHQVNADVATHFGVSVPASVTAGSAFSITVTARDQFENVATGYAGTVHFTKSDSGAGSVVPADYTFVAGDNGVHTFTNGVTFVTAPSQTVTATDTVTSSITGNANVTVSAAAATHDTVTAPALVTAGSSFSFSVTAQDAFGNTATGYAGTVHFTSTDGAAVLPADSTLTSGTGTFSATLTTTGSQTITATDTVAGSINGTTGTITVAPAGPAALSGIITNKTGTANARVWTVTVSNGGPGAAYNARLDGLTLTQTAGAACTPVITSSFPAVVGNVAPVSSGGGAVTIDFTGCAAAVQFRADIGFSANAGADTGGRTLYHQFE